MKVPVAGENRPATQPPLVTFLNKIKTFMHRLFLLLLICSCSMAAIPHEQDPQYCAYWFKNFDEIIRLEEMISQDVLKVAKEDSLYAAMDFELELRGRIRAIIRNMAGESKWRRWKFW